MNAPFQIWRTTFDAVTRWCLKIARPGGRIGMIVSASFLVLPTFTKLRKVLLENATIDVLAPLGPKVFEDATVDTAIIAMKNTPPTKGSRTRIFAPVRPALLE